MDSSFPKISIITPSFNQGAYIEETILSVIGQHYPNLEYIIIDGGSSDNTVEVIKKYEKHITFWESKPDNGQSHAINKGFRKASGSIMGWLNSDDLYLPSTLSFMARTVNSEERCIYFGNCIHFNEQPNETVSYGSNVINARAKSSLTLSDYIIQPSSFWTRATFEEVGDLREDLHFGFDWEWFLRAQNIGVSFLALAKCLSMYRFHHAHKSSTGGTTRQQELLGIYRQYAPESALLYEMLLSEPVDLNSFKTQVLVRLLGKSGRQSTFGDLLKKIKPRQYSKYTADQINEVRYML